MITFNSSDLQVEDKFKMLRIETEKKGPGGGKRGGAKGEPEIPPAVQVELVDLSKQVCHSVLLKSAKKPQLRKNQHFKSKINIFFIPKTLDWILNNNFNKENQLTEVCSIK